jgi:hypothetical protein
MPVWPGWMYLLMGVIATLVVLLVIPGGQV